MQWCRVGMAAGAVTLSTTFLGVKIGKEAEWSCEQTMCGLLREISMLLLDSLLDFNAVIKKCAQIKSRQF